MLSVNDRKDLYEEMLHLYDLCDKIIDVLEDTTQKDRFLKVELATPAIKAVQETTDNLTELYALLEEENRPATAKEKKVFEASIRQSFAALLDFIQRVKALPA